METIVTSPVDLPNRLDADVHASRELNRARAVLQRQAPVRGRRHALRNVARFAGFVVLDMALFVVFREIAAVWVSLATDTANSPLIFDVLPVAYLQGWQFPVALLLGLLVTGNYGRGDLRRAPGRLVLGCALATALVLWTPLWSSGSRVILAQYVAVVLILSALLMVGRLAVDLLARFGLSHRPIRTVFVGSAQDCRAVSSGPAFGNPIRCEHVGVIEHFDSADPDQIFELRRKLLDRNVDAVVLCGHLDDVDLMTLVQTVGDAGCQLLSVPRDFRVIGTEPKFFWHRGQPLIQLISPAGEVRDSLIKRSIDLVVSGLGLACLVPVFLVIAVAIRLDSRGPVFYRSERWGQYGRRIGIWKFRTMKNGAVALLDADQALKAEYVSNIKLVRDPRVTRMGRLLRKFSLDELPQLFNVLTGDMSLVGPRPKLIDEEEKYGAAMATVLSVRPGLTGLWQVSGRNTTTYEERISLDIQYVTRASLWWDLFILLRTVPVVVTGHGAH